MRHPSRSDKLKTFLEEDWKSSSVNWGLQFKKDILLRGNVFFYALIK
jgi:hypothetical protein